VVERDQEWGRYSILTWSQRLPIMNLSTTSVDGVVDDNNVPAQFTSSVLINESLPDATAVVVKSVEECRIKLEQFRK
jgi:hypothetical protein